MTSYPQDRLTILSRLGLLDFDLGSGCSQLGARPLHRSAIQTIIQARSLYPRACRFTASRCTPLKLVICNYQETSDFQKHEIEPEYETFR